MRFQDTAPVDSYDLRRAVGGRHESWLRRLGRADPVTTLAFLDVSMRGLTAGYDASSFEALLSRDDAARAHVEWLVEMDAALRLELGARRRDADVEILRAAYLAGDLVLVVGAGAGMAAGLPGWRELVIRVLRRALWYGSVEHREELREAAARGGTIGVAGSTYVLSTAQDARARAERAKWAERVELPVLTGEQRALAQATVDALSSQESYASELLLAATQVAVDFWGDAFNRELTWVLGGCTLRRNRLHPAIARMVRPDPPRVWAILTYNFDTLIESAVLESGHGFTVSCCDGGHPVTTRGLGLAQLADAVEIHHVHGLVPNATFLRDPAAVDIVFSAEQFERQYGPDNAWTRRLQTAYFGHAPAFIIGSSLQDRYAVDQLVAVHERRPWWHHCAALALPREHGSHAGSLAAETLRGLDAPYERMGLRVLWLADREELPDLLDEIRTEPHGRAERLAAEAAMAHAERAHRAGDDRSAGEALEEAVSFEGTLGTRATYMLGLLRDQQGAAEPAEQLLRRAMASGDREWSGLAGSRLGYILAEAGRLGDAREAYHHALATEQSTATAEAHAGLKRLAGRW